MSRFSSTEHNRRMDEIGACFRRGDFAAALSRCQEYLAMDAHWNVSYIAGQCCRFMGRFGDAERHLRHSLASGGEGDAAVHTALGIVLQQVGRDPESIQSFERAVQIDPTNVIARNSLGLALKLDGQIDRAHEQYSQAMLELVASIIASSPNSPSQQIMPDPMSFDGVWLQVVMTAVTRIAARLNLDGVAWPTGEQAASRQLERDFGGALYRTVQSPDGKRLLFIHPNLLNTVFHALRTTPVYCRLLNNLAAIYVARGDSSGARERLAESIAFTPAGYDYPDPRLALRDLDSSR
ncbi:MAG: tetratricopeptide repeat protein [Fimbriimonadaceae bacterium]|nr:tetratricopeptide repeat protein [Fimbriimonadaceae bacterium]